MYCIKCGSYLPEGAAYCPQCASPQAQSKGVKWSHVILAGVGALFGVLSMIFTFLPRRDSTGTAQNQRPATPVTSPSSLPATPSLKSTHTPAPATPRPVVIIEPAGPTATPTPANPTPPGNRTLPVAGGSFLLRAHSYRAFPFRVVGDGRTILLKGKFEVSGGGSRDVQALVFDEDGFNRFKNRNLAFSYYNSGRVTSGNVNAELSTRKPGTYYLVFNNMFSILTPKAVNADVSLEY